MVGVEDLQWEHTKPFIILIIYPLNFDADIFEGILPLFSRFNKRTTNLPPWCWMWWAVSRIVNESIISCVEIPHGRARAQSSLVPQID